MSADELPKPKACEPGKYAGERKEIMLPGGVKLELAWRPPGTLIMGDDKSECSDEKPAVQVELTKGFWMGLTPVTQSQWQAVTEISPNNFQGLQLPVTNVS